MSNFIPIRFAGTGSYLPEEILTNDYFEKILDTSDEWIASRTGIRARRRAGKDENTSVLSARAGEAAIKDAGLSPEEIDVIILATATPDHPFPSTAAFVQHRLGCTNAAAFDIGAACSGFLHACWVAAGQIQAGMAKNILVIGAETLSRFLDYEERGVCILMGDGAGAVVMSKAEREGQGILHATLGCDGSKAKHIWIPAGGATLPSSKTTVSERMHYMQMKGRDVFKFAVVKMASLIDEAMEKTGLSPDDLKMVIPHQSNLRIIEAARERLGLPAEKIAVNIERYGNTSAASVPITLDEVWREGRVASGDKVMLLAIGAGLTWGSMVIEL
jgi:3-oxoacyl-[acyl-carrier-protein] synthase III